MQGPSGADGADGLAGADGAAGLAGADGADGSQGPQGDQGIQGIAGAAGADGAMGPAGADGVDGLPGADGAAGADGADGAAGAQGPIGLTGAAGADGATGPQGPAGTDGTDGPAGADGQDGATGSAGANGLDGLDGTTPWTELTGYSSISTIGSIRISDDPTICDGTYAGTIRYNSAIATFEGCNGTEWAAFSPQGPGSVLYAIGDTGPAGGIVFYITGGGLSGLEAAPADQDGGSGAPWGCYTTLIAGADGTAVGTGAQNTADILAGCSEAGTAASIVDAYTLGGYDDWFLPSKDELNVLYAQKAVVGGFANTNYWSSTEYSGGNGWSQSEVHAITYGRGSSPL